MNRIFKSILALFCCLALSAGLTGCMRTENGIVNAGADIPELPDRLDLNDDGVPILRVYNTSTQKSEEMDVESYLMGVVAGEMKNTWPIEALKAQAILARTFTMKFVSSKTSRYENADISTDIHEAQAYNAEDINDRIREAVNETRGIVMTADGDFTHAWFHAHSGGATELPTKALEYSEDPAYLSVVESNESAQAPEEVKRWIAKFSLEEAERACRNVGVETGEISSFEIGERGESGRAVTFLVNGKSVSAPAFRLQVGASSLKSTLIDSISISSGSVVFRGSGFGHGVGMSQWGAHQMAAQGMTAEEIIKHYYSGVDLVELW